MSAPDPTIDRVAFAREVLGLAEVYDHQARALRATNPFVVLPGGRRSGKSVTAQVAGLHCVVTRRGADWLVTGPNEDKIRATVGEYAELLSASKIARSASVDEQAMRLDLLGSNSAIVGVLATGGQLRGHGRRTYGIHVEEAGHCPPGVLRDIRYVLADHVEEGAQCWMTGSPWGNQHFFRESFQLGADGDPDYYADVWKSTMNPRLPKDWLERERRRLNSVEAAAELDGEWQDSGAAFFTRAILEAATADVAVEAPDTLALLDLEAVR